MYFFRHIHLMLRSAKDNGGGHRSSERGDQTIRFHQVQYPYSTDIQRLLSTEPTHTRSVQAILIG